MATFVGGGAYFACCLRWAPLLLALGMSAESHSSSVRGQKGSRSGVASVSRRALQLVDLLPFNVSGSCPLSPRRVAALCALLTRLAFSSLQVARNSLARPPLRPCL